MEVIRLMFFFNMFLGMTNNIGFFILFLNNVYRTVIMMLSKSIFFFKSLSFFSVFFYTTFKLSETLKESFIVNYVFYGLGGLYFFSIKSVGGLKSLESSIPALRWIEREVSEFSGLSFIGKSDSRFLFLWFGVSGNPLKKLFPVSGFWSLRVFYDFSLCFFRVEV